MDKNDILLSLAITIASKEFNLKFDKSGKPYILHCLYVMNEVRNEGSGAMIIAVLHDLLEDTNYSCDDLLKQGFSFNIVSRIKLLTRDKETSYDDYIRNISTDKLCVKIKLADLKHNSDITRLKGLTKKDFNRLEKYCRSYEYLKGI